MACVVKKRVGGRERFFLMESRTRGGQVRQEVICELGGCSSVDEALRRWQEQAERDRVRAEAYCVRALPHRPAWMPGARRPYRHSRFDHYTTAAGQFAGRAAEAERNAELVRRRCGRR